MIEFFFLDLAFELDFKKFPLYIFLEQKFGVSTMKNSELYGVAPVDDFKIQREY